MPTAQTEDAPRSSQPLRAAPKTRTTQQEVTWTGVLGARVRRSGAVIRTDPGPFAQEQGKLAPGDPVSVLRREGDWVMVEVGGVRRGWVKANDVEMQ